jgi:superfamily II DNA or RNA helicase
MKAVISNRIYLNYDADLLEKLKGVLTYSFQPSNPEAMPEIVCNATSIGKRAITIPSGRVDLIPKGWEIVDKRVYPKYKFPEMAASIKLRPDQQEIYDNIEGDCIINAQPGWGKTFTGLAIAAKFGLKTLIVVHNVALRQQWEDEYFKMFGERAGVIGSGRKDINSPVVIANVQTLSKIAGDVADKFGLIIMDEVHHCPASTFKNIIDKSKASIKVGLSATLVRRDKKHILLYDFFGKKLFKPEEQNRMKPTVTMVYTETELSSNRMIPWATKVNSIANNMRHRHLIIDLANSAIDGGHKTLVLGDRVEFLDYCASLTKSAVAITGQTEDRKALLKRVFTDIGAIYGTTSIFKEGISVDILSCVILAFPVSHLNLGMLEQIIGRITREYKGKMNPHIIDVCYKGATGKRQAAGRLNYYINMGYSVKEVHI